MKSQDIAAVRPDIAGGPGPYGPAEGDSLGAYIRYALALVRRNYRVMVGIVAAALLLAFVLTLLATPKYTATTSIQINDQSEQVLGDDIEGRQSVNSPYDVDRFLNTQLQVLRSRELATRVANRLDLGNDPAFWTAMESSYPEDLSDALRKDAATGMVGAGLSVDLPFETRIAFVSFTSADPVMSAKIANAYAEEFIQSNLQRRYDSSSYAREFIADQLDEAKSRLEASERDLNAYARQAGLIRSRNTGTGTEDTGASSVTSDSLAQLNEAANAAAANHAAAEARWRTEMSQPLLSSSAVQGNLTIQQLQTERARIDTRLEALRARYLDDYPEIAQLRNESEAIDKQIRTVAASLRDGIRSDYVAAQAAEARLRSQVDQLQNATMAEQDRAVRYNTLAREADTNRQLYDGLLQRYRELNAAAGISTSNLAIIDTAQVPSGPSSPNLFRNLAIALLLGAAAALAYVFLRDQLDDAIRIPEDVEEKARIPLIGVIPAAQEGSPDEELQDPKSPVSEAYNALRGSLLYSSSNGLPKVLLVTSAQSGEGKSTTSFATAQGLAKMGRKTVIIDADLRRPSLHKRIGRKTAVGLSDLLTQGGDVDMSVETLDGNLSVITAGPLPPSPPELLASARFSQLLEQLLERFDNVVIDGPPVLGLADAPVIAAVADGVLMVIESERVGRGIVKTALRRLREVRPNILGAVLTKFDAQKLGNSYSSYYGYEYYRYSHDDAG